MATTINQNQYLDVALREVQDADLDAALREVQAVLDHYGLGNLKYYLLVREPGRLENYIIRHPASDTSDFPDRLVKLHADCCKHE